MGHPARDRSARAAPQRAPRPVPRPAVGLCVETQGREIMATLVNEVVADAMHLGLHDAPAADETKPPRPARARDRVRHD